MNINEIKQEIKATFEYNLTTTRHVDKLTPMIWGGPGLGKSQIIYQIGEEISYEVIDLRLATINPVDARGFPVPDEATGKGAFLKPYYFPVGNDNVRRILFLDEISSALPTNQVTGYELCQDYAVGGQPLPQEVLIVAAGNREQDGGVSFEMPRPLQNRLQHFTVEASPTAFKKYGIASGLREEIIGFINFKPEMLNDENPLEMAFPTPRSWDKLSKRTGTGPFSRSVVESIVGYGASSAFMTYLQINSSLPDLDKALEERIPFIQGEKSLLYAFVSGLAYRVLRNPTPKKVNNFTFLVGKLSEELKLVGFNMLMDKDFLANFIVPNLGELTEMEEAFGNANLTI